jgi:hypothetical protein
MFAGCGIYESSRQKISLPGLSAASSDSEPIFLQGYRHPLLFG